MRWMALDFVPSLVANPGIVKPMMSVRGRPSRSIALAATMRAWVESRPPRDADDDLGLADGAQPLLEPGHLDVVGLVAVLGEPGLVVGDEREAVDLAAQADVAGRRVELERDDPEGLAAGLADALDATVVVEAALADPLLPQPVEVDVDDRGLRSAGEALALAEQVAHLVDHRHAVPREVGRRLTLARGGIQVGRVAARARGAREEVAVVGAADGDGGGAEVEQHGRAGEGGAVARRHRHPHVLADLDVDGEPGDVGRLEEEVGAVGDVAVLVGAGPVRAVDEGVDRVVAGGEPALLVELAVVGQVGLRRDPEDLAALDDDGAVEQAVADEQGGADDDDRGELGGGLGDGDDRPVDLVEEDVLHVEVVDGVAAEARARGRGRPRRRRRGGPRTCSIVASALLGRVGHDDGQGAGGDAGEPVRVGVAEVHAPSLSECGCALCMCRGCGWQRGARDSSTPTPTRSSPRSSSATTRTCAGGRWSSVRRWSPARATRPARSASMPVCRCFQALRRWPELLVARLPGGGLRGGERRPAWRSSVTSRRSSSPGSMEEAFLDVSALDGGSVEEAGRIAAALRERARRELGLPVSAGVARAKLFAKLASRRAKPDGLVVVDAETEARVRPRLPVADLWGVGPATTARLHDAGIVHVADLAGWSVEALVERRVATAMARNLVAIRDGVDDATIRLPAAPQVDLVACARSAAPPASARSSRRRCATTSSARWTGWPTTRALPTRLDVHLRYDDQHAVVRPGSLARAHPRPGHPRRCGARGTGADGIRGGRPGSGDGGRLVHAPDTNAVMKATAFSRWAAPSRGSSSITARRVSSVSPATIPTDSGSVRARSSRWCPRALSTSWRR